MARWFEKDYKPEEMNPVDDLNKIFEKSRAYRENPLLVPAELKEMFDSAAQKAREAGIFVPRIEAVWRKEGITLKCKECNFFEEERNHCALEPDNYGIVFPETDACKSFFQDTDYDD